jgi:hypothetical protein
MIVLFEKYRKIQMKIKACNGDWSRGILGT